MKPKDLQKMFEAETDFRNTDWNKSYNELYLPWLEKFACKVCENLDIAESVMYPFPKPK